MLVALLLLVSPSSAGLRREEAVVVPIPRPEVAIIITRQHLTPNRDLELKQTFLPKVVGTVQQKPF